MMNGGMDIRMERQSDRASRLRKIHMLYETENIKNQYYLNPTTKREE